MGSSDKRLYEFVGVRKHNQTELARDFWMPDRSCRVCYECDARFTILNRRHHCRHCGRVFCAKCTSNFIPSLSYDQNNTHDEAERVRVCNFCYKQWEKNIVPADEGIKLSSPLSSSSSSASLVSTKSSATGNSTVMTGDSLSHSVGASQHPLYGTLGSPSQSVRIDSSPDKLDVMPGRSTNPIGDTGDPSHSQFGFCMNRSNDDDDDEVMCRSDSEAQYLQQILDFPGSIEFDEVDRAYQSKTSHPTEENVYDMDACSSLCSIADPNSSLGVCVLAQEPLSSNGQDHDASSTSTIYGMEVTGGDTVDFENHGLWHPPEPEDEEDEKEVVLFEDEEEADVTGEWGYLRSTNSFGSGEYRNKDRSVEEHRKAMKSVVDDHFRALVAQLLRAANVPIGEDDEGWLDIITSLSWEASSLLKPNTSNGGMDPGGYVKVKCIASGHRNESMVVRGVVCKKNVANRHMISNIENPRILVLGGALEYHRVVNQLSSVDTLLQQEKDHLKMAVARIDAHHPNVLLVEKSVSRFARDYLLAKNISLVLNIKRPLLERLSRCTGTPIVPSVDYLSSSKLGHCALFRVEKFFEEHGSAGQEGKKLVKTVMFFEGCPKPLGCTILLKGANGGVLKILKKVVQLGVFAAYHLALETSFLVDEGATLLELPLKSPITATLADNLPSPKKSISTVPHMTKAAAEQAHITEVVHELNNISGITGSLDGISALNSNDGGLLFNSQVRAPQLVLPRSISPNYDSFYSARGKNEFGFGELMRDKMSMLDDRTASQVPSTKVDSLEIIRGWDTANGSSLYSQCPLEEHPEQRRECTKDVLHQVDGDKDESALSKEFPNSPTDHQIILVSVSRRCIWNGTVCERAHLLRIKYYGRWDKPLGRFLRDHIFDESYRCHSCEMPTEAHVHVYTHRQGSLTISVRKLPEVPLRGERDGKIWMWHRCLKCPRVNGFPSATRRVVMSDAAWGLSFGKFLELSFSNHAAASRVASCGHSLHRDCLRFYGFGKMVACFKYSSINVHSVYLPPYKIDFNCHLHDWVQKEADEVADLAELLFSDVLNAVSRVMERRLHAISLNDGDTKVLGSRRHILELELMTQKEKAEFEECFEKVIKEERNGHHGIDILEINKLRRQLIFQSFLWDQRLILAASDHKPHDVLRDFITNKGFSDGVVYLKESSNFESFSSLDAAPKDSPAYLSSNMRSFVENQGGLTEHHTQTGASLPRIVVEKDDTFGSKALTSISSSPLDKFDGLETGYNIPQVPSDGQFTITTDLSDVLDVRWRGEHNHSVADERKPILSIHVEVTGAITSSNDSEGNCAGDVSQSLSTLHNGSECSREDFSSLIGVPFVNFYRHVNMNWVGSQNYDALGEYRPSYILSFLELGRWSGARMLLPVGLDERVIPIFDDEPTSIISYALLSPDYIAQMLDMLDRVTMDSSSTVQLLDSGDLLSSQLGGESFSDSSKSLGPTDENVSSMPSSRSTLPSDPLTYTKAMHARVSFADEGPLGKAKYNVTCYYAQRFEALRRICCPSEIDFVRSLSRCKKWGAQGGKSNVFFAKTLDERFIIKQVTKTELESFIKFAPEYFKYLSHTISSRSPTCLAKILGIYQVTSKHLKGGKESKMDLLVMENLFFGQNLTRLYDLKGSARSRYNSDSGGSNKVLLDQNLIESMPTSPIFVGRQAKRLLERAVWNDTAFLASVDVMDYSLLVGVNEEKQELVLGIIDFMRQYTWDKHLETWVKASGILGGPKNEAPTVVSPLQYKKRFRKAMTAYFVMVPDEWPPSLFPSKSQSDLEEHQQGIQ